MFDRSTCRGIPALLQDSAEADQGTRAMTAATAIRSWTHTEKVFCWPGVWLLFLLALKEGLNMLMECPDLRLCLCSWNNAYVSNQYGLPLSETNNMWGMQVRASVWKTTKSISVKGRKEYWKLQCLLKATMRYFNLGSFTKVWKHFVTPPKPILCTRPEAFWGLYGTKRYRSVSNRLKSPERCWQCITPSCDGDQSIWNSNKNSSITTLPFSSCHYPVLVPVSELDYFRAFSVSTAHKDSYHVPTSHSCYWLV